MTNEVEMLVQEIADLLRDTSSFVHRISAGEFHLQPTDRVDDVTYQLNRRLSMLRNRVAALSLVMREAS